MVRLHAPVLERLPLHRDHDRCSKTPEGPQRREGVRLCPGTPPGQAGRLHGIRKQVCRLKPGVFRKIPEPGTEDRLGSKVEEWELNTLSSAPPRVGEQRAHSRREQDSGHPGHDEMADERDPFLHGQIDQPGCTIDNPACADDQEDAGAKEIEARIKRRTRIL